MPVTRHLATIGGRKSFAAGFVIEQASLHALLHLRSANDAMAVDEDRHQEAIELEGDEDESLLNEDVQLHRRPAPGNRLRRYCTFSIWWWLTNVVMGIVIIYLAFQVDSNRTLLSRYELAGDITKIGPRCKNILYSRSLM